MYWAVFGSPSRLTSLSGGSMHAAHDLVRQWRIARDTIGAKVIQQTVLPVFPSLIGNNEHRLAGSPARLVERVNLRLREFADVEGVDILAIDRHAAAHGLDAWYDPVPWHRAKQEVHPKVTPLYGDLLGRLLQARQGRSFKCLVLDLDNTLWGGVIGDDGLEGIVLGQGSARGRGIRRLPGLRPRSFQNAASSLPCVPRMTRRTRLNRSTSTPTWCCGGAISPASPRVGRTRPRRSEASPNNSDIGLDALVFADDNPFERDHRAARATHGRGPGVARGPGALRGRAG